MTCCTEPGNRRSVAGMSVRRRSRRRGAVIAPTGGRRTANGSGAISCGALTKSGNRVEQTGERGEQGAPILPPTIRRCDHQQPTAGAARPARPLDPRGHLRTSTAPCGTEARNIATGSGGGAWSAVPRCPRRDRREKKSQPNPRPRRGASARCLTISAIRKGTQPAPSANSAATGPTRHGDDERPASSATLPTTSMNAHLCALESFRFETICFAVFDAMAAR